VIILHPRAKVAQRLNDGLVEAATRRSSPLWRRELFCIYCAELTRTVGSYQPSNTTVNKVVAEVPGSAYLQALSE